jgi:chemotaxis protein CheD
MRTLLGSCVSITLWHPPTRIGGMSHFLLPTRIRSGRSKKLDARYGDEALQLMLRELEDLGVAPEQCQAKIFGGGNMFPGQRQAAGINVGQRNGEAAIALLSEHGIPVLSESLFGAGHRQIIFDISSGDVWSSQIAPTPSETTLVGDLF